MRPRRHRAGGALQEEDKDTNIDLMLAESESESAAANNGSAHPCRASINERRRKGMPDWLKRKLLGQEDLKPEPLPHVPGSVSAVRDRWAQQLREIEEMAGAGNPVPVPARLTSDPVGIADPEWDDMVHREAAASGGGGGGGGGFSDGFSGGDGQISSQGDRGSGDRAVGQRRQTKNLYNVLMSNDSSPSSSSEKNSDSSSWFNRWMK